MGWWSATIMGGDTPLDYLSVLAKAFDVEFDCDAEDTFHCQKFTREKLEVRDAAERLRKAHKKMGEDVIFGQVVGATFLWAGAEMPEKVKKGVIECAKADGWAKEDEERKKYINDFIEAVENHKPGERTEVTEEGLFSKIAKVLTR